MPALPIQNPTLLDLARAKDPDGKIAIIIELLNQTNEILDDMAYIEGNLETGHQSVVRTGLPIPTWRKLYGGVIPTKGTTMKIIDTTAMLEAYAEIDKALADLNGNGAAYRMTQDAAHLEGMNQQMAQTLFYGSEINAPETFTGLAPRFSSRSAPNGENIIDAGGTGSDNASIWLVFWSPTTCHGIIPKGSVAGFQMTDKGQVTSENVDGAGGRMEIYRTHYRWDAGLCLADWRYVVRIANIDKSDLRGNASAGADLIDLMTQAIELVPSTSMGRGAFYMSRTLRSILRRQMVAAVKASTLTMEQIAGKRVLAFDGIPVRRVDVLAADEARVI